MKIYHIYDKRITFDLPDPVGTCQIGRGEKAYQMTILYAGFDIETTNIDEFGTGWAAYAYHFQICLANDTDQYVYLFRNWENLLWFLEHIINIYNTVESHIIMWVANLSFEFQFIRKRLQWSDGEFDFFAKEERQPLKATYKGIEFREALAISGGDLAYTAKTYCKTQKLITYLPDGTKVSDLDYSIPRNHLTPLTELEEQYCINDVVILAEFSQYIFNKYIKKEHRIPMTKTSILIQEFRDYYRALCRKRDKSNHLEPGLSDLMWYDYLQSCFPDKDTYILWFQYLFRGGYVHANAPYVDTILSLRMRDITSHYPGRMNLDYVPRTPFRKVEFQKTYIKTKCCILHIIYDHIESTTTHSIESRSKCVNLIGAKLDNGRVRSADLMEVYLTEQDYQIYQMFYTAQHETVLECWISERGKQPRYVRDVLNKHYIDKNYLKTHGMKDTQEYTIEKASVNTCYGAEVKRIRLDKTDYIEDEWVTHMVDVDYDEEAKKQLLLPQWGIWVTSGARFQLLSILYKLTMAGVIVVYMDTDSIKYVGSHKAEQIFKHYNNNIKRHRHNRKIRRTEFDDLAEFDIELKDSSGRPLSVPFKTLGAKRYIYQSDGIVHATVAGMPKSSINELGPVEEIFDKFSLSGYSLNADQSGKLTTRYRDNPHWGLVAGERMEELSSVALYKIPFKISIKGEYRQLVEERKEELERCKL